MEGAFVRPPRPRSGSGRPLGLFSRSGGAQRLGHRRRRRGRERRPDTLPPHDQFERSSAAAVGDPARIRTLDRRHDSTSPRKNPRQPVLVRRVRVWALGAPALRRRRAHGSLENRSVRPPDRRAKLPEGSSTDGRHRQPTARRSCTTATPRSRLKATLTAWGGDFLAVFFAEL